MTPKVVFHDLPTQVDSMATKPLLMGTQTLTNNGSDICVTKRTFCFSSQHKQTKAELMNLPIISHRRTSFHAEKRIPAHEMRDNCFHTQRKDHPKPQKPKKAMSEDCHLRRTVSKAPHAT